MKGETVSRKGSRSRPKRGLLDLVQERIQGESVKWGQVYQESKGIKEWLLHSLGCWIKDTCTVLGAEAHIYNPSTWGG